jgi:MFS family permease
MRRASLGAIFLTIFLDLLGFGIVFPFLSDEARTVFHTTPFVGTLLASVYSAMQFLCAPLWGRLSDRVGRRPVLTISVAMTAVSMLGLGAALAWGGSIVWLFVARTIGGAATANLGVGSAYIADVTKPEDRAKGMALFGVAFGLGFILGPAVGGVLAEIAVNGRHGPVACFAAAALSVVNLVWVVLGLPESLPEERREEAARRRAAQGAKGIADHLRDEPLRLVVLTNFVVILSFTNLEATFRFFNADAFGMSMNETGKVLAFIGVIGALVQGGVVRRLSGKVADSSLIGGGLVFQVAAFALFAAAPDLGRAALYVAGALAAFGNGISQPSVSAFVSKRADASEQGAVLGANQAVASLARMFGPAIGGALYTYLGLRAPYLSGALGMAVALVLIARVKTAERSEAAGLTAVTAR